MQSLPLFSIIIPVYNAQKYLENAVQGVLAQTISDFELFLVNDGSQDNSGRMCDRLALTDRRIKVIHLAENKGLSHARNAALEQVSGKYIFCMDADDRIENTLLETAWDAFQKNDADVTVFGVKEEYFHDNGELRDTFTYSFPQDQFLSEREQVRAVVMELEEKTLYGYAWNKVYKAEVIQKHRIRFDENDRTLEDIFFNIKVFDYVNKLNILSATPYYYRKGVPGSLTTKYIPYYFVYHQKKIEALYAQFTQWGICSEDIKNKLANLFVRYIFSALQRNCDKQSAFSHKDRKQFLIDLYSAPIFTDLITYAGSSNRIVSCMVTLLKKRNYALTLCMARMIYFVKTFMPAVFEKASRNR